MHATEPNGRPGDRLKRGLADGDADHDGSGPPVSRAAAALLAERLRGKVGPRQSVSELAVRAASALPDHYAAHAQLIQFDTDAPCEGLRMSLTVAGLPPLRAFKRMSSTVIGRP
jgi:hypothetical protein